MNITKNVLETMITFIFLKTIYIYIYIYILNLQIGLGNIFPIHLKVEGSYFEKGIMVLFNKSLLS